MDNKINMYNPKIEYNLRKEEIDGAIQNVLNHGLFINGPEVRELETQLKSYVGARHAIACGNGTDALHIALLALGIAKDDEVITVAHTWISTSEVIGLCSATPVWVDINKDTFCIDEEQIESAINEKTKAIIAVSLYGSMPNYEKIQKIASKYNIPVIEDGAQSFGSIRNGNYSCSCKHTTIATTSFFPSKPLGSYGDGGCMFTNDEHLAEKMKAIRSHGGLKRFQHTYIGMNSRLDTIQASILLTKFKYYDQTRKNRNRVAQYYIDNIKNNNLVMPINHSSATDFNVFAQFSILTPSSDYRDKLIAHLKENNINPAIFYPVSLDKQECFKNKSIKMDLTNTHEVCDTIINLPIYGELSDNTCSKIVSIINNFSL
jgi:UDP-2-acetamido-2-deoxy-ribo-hexuluronate aminotransferase